MKIQNPAQFADAILTAIDGPMRRLHGRVQAWRNATKRCRAIEVSGSLHGISYCQHDHTFRRAVDLQRRDRRQTWHIGKLDVVHQARANAMIDLLLADMKISRHIEAQLRRDAQLLVNLGGSDVEVAAFLKLKLQYAEVKTHILAEIGWWFDARRTAKPLHSSRH